MALSEAKLQQLDKKLIELAITDFDMLCQIAGVDKVQAFVCLERSRGKSYGQIATVLGIKRESVYDRAKKCACKK